MAAREAPLDAYEYGIIFQNASLIPAVCESCLGLPAMVA
jgi:hypothetical protein